jgi:hypothetical protein
VYHCISAFALYGRRLVSPIPLVRNSDGEFSETGAKAASKRMPSRRRTCFTEMKWQIWKTLYWDIRLPLTEVSSKRVLAITISPEMQQQRDCNLKPIPFMLSRYQEKCSVYSRSHDAQQRK